MYRNFDSVPRSWPLSSPMTRIYSRLSSMHRAPIRAIRKRIELFFRLCILQNDDERPTDDGNENSLRVTFSNIKNTLWPLASGQSVVPRCSLRVMTVDVAYCGVCHT